MEENSPARELSPAHNAATEKERLPHTPREAGPSATDVASLSGLVAIKWLDHAAEPDWTPVEQLRDDPQEIVTVGIPVKETAGAIILAASISDTDLPKPQWVVAETTMILKPLIVWVMPLAAIAKAVGTSAPADSEASSWQAPGETQTITEPSGKEG